VVLVGDREKVLALEAVGFADVEANTSMKSDALFWIASQSKPMTAAAVMMLVDEGKLKLDEPVETYLPELKELKLKNGERPKTPVTLRRLLSHTSGMAFRSAREQPTLDLFPLAEGVASYAATPLEYEPGTKYQYSNAGFNTAGRIVEVVSGMPYETFIQQRLFDPLGMTDTTFWPSDEQVARLAKSYKPNAAKDGLEALAITQLKYPLTDPARRPMPAGGLFSTTGDVARFLQMMLNGGASGGKRVLSEAAVGEMTRRQTPETLKDSYGLGFATNSSGFGHGGAYATNMWVDTRRGLVFVYHVQHAGFPGDGGKAQGAFRSAAEAAFGGGPAK
jgi:CubicO group peptidase (beta-lactamase class C family)